MSFAVDEGGGGDGPGMAALGLKGRLRRSSKTIELKVSPLELEALALLVRT